MTTSLPHIDGPDPETPPSVLSRFAITTLEQDLDECTVVASMPVGGMRNPFTGQPTLAGLAVLVDDVAGRVNFLRRGPGRWTVSSELTVDFAPGAVDALLAGPHEPVLASARPLGGAGAPMLAVCTLTHRGTTIGSGAVHTVELDGTAGPAARRGPDPLVRTAQTTLTDLLAAEPMPGADGAYRLRQRPDPMVNNLIGIVHGGVSTAGLELVAAAAVNHRQDRPLRTASIRANFLRPFFAGAQSSYVGTALRIGRTSAVGDARAVGDDGKVAVLARVTAYR